MKGHLTRGIRLVRFDGLMPIATGNARKMDFGMHAKGPDRMRHSGDNNRIRVKSSRFSLPDPHGSHCTIKSIVFFIFGLLIHGWGCYITLFLASCAIATLPFKLYDSVIVMRVVTAPYAVRPIGRG